MAARRASRSRCDVHDFPDTELGKAIPYGVYDLAANTGWVNVGTDHDTAAFAVESIRRWWNGGRPERLPAGPAAADHRRRRRLQRLPHPRVEDRTRRPGRRDRAGDHRLPPPAGHSKWNKIEHRLFSHITMNWRGRPLTSHEVIVQTIAATTTRTGLTRPRRTRHRHLPHRRQDQRRRRWTPCRSTRHDFHGDWNYTLNPTNDQAPDLRDGPRPESDGSLPTSLLSHPALTGMSRDELVAMTDHLAPAQAAQRERQRHTRRGAERHRAPGAGGRPKLTESDRVLATVLYLRRLCTQAVLGELFAVDRGTITRTIQQTRPLLEQNGYPITPSPARFPAPADLVAFLARRTEAPAKIKPAC